MTLRGETVRELLQGSRVVVSPERFAFIALTKEAWARVISDPSLSPRTTSPFMILMDEHEVTLMLDDADLANIRPGLGDARIEQGFRLITFDVELEFDVVGFIAGSHAF